MEGSEEIQKQIVNFWFGELEHIDSAIPEDVPKKWYKKDQEFDNHLKEKYGGLIEKALKGELDKWAETPYGE